MNEQSLGPALLAHARWAIAERLGLAGEPPVTPAPLEAPGACFVTLSQAGALRGCIGSLEVHRPLVLDVTENARAAAFRDPRFAPVSAGEWPGIQVEVSLLGPPEALEAGSEAELLAQLRPGVDGLILAAGPRRATFLPQVWEQLPDGRDFLLQLRRKAGLPGDYWGPDLRCWRYQVRKWREA